MDEINQADRLAVLVQADINALLDGLQVGHGGVGYSSGLGLGGNKRKKALRKWDKYYHEQEPTLSMSQAMLMLIGDEDRPGRIGLVQLSGMTSKSSSKNRNPHSNSGGPSVNSNSGAKFSRTAIQSLELLDRIINAKVEAPSTSIVREAFGQLPLSVINEMRLDEHIINPRTRKQAFRLVYALRSEQIQLKHLNSSFIPFKLDQIIIDEDAHDMYVEWEVRDDEGDSSDEDQRATEWADIFIADISDEDEDSESNRTNNLYRSMKEKKQQNSESDMSFKIQGNEHSGFEGGAFEDQNRTEVSHRIYDPLGIVTSLGDNATTTSIPDKMTLRLNTFNDSNSKADTLSVSPTSSGSRGSSQIFPDSSRGSSSSRRKLKFKRLLKGKTSLFSRYNSNTHDSGSIGSNSLSDLAVDTIADALEQETFQKSTSASGSSRARGLSMLSPRSKHKPRASILYNSEFFDSGLFLWRVHHDSSLDDLERGLKNIEKDSETQNETLKRLVHDNFDEFVHCRHTIDQIHKLMQQEISTNEVFSGGVSSKSKHKAGSAKNMHPGIYRNSRTSTSRIAKVEQALAEAEGTVKTNFDPLLEKRRRIKELRRANELLKKFEYLWLLPHKLRDQIEKMDWVGAAVRLRDVYHHLAAFHELEKQSKEENSNAEESEQKHESKGIVPTRMDFSSGQADFYKSTMHELEACGEQLCIALLEMIKTPANAEKIKAKDVAGGETEKTVNGVVLNVKQKNILDPYEALNLLLEIREHVPKSSKISKLIHGDDKDPFITFVNFQSEAAVKYLDSVLKQLDSHTNQRNTISSVDLVNVAQDIGNNSMNFLDLWKKALSELDVSQQAGASSSPLVPGPEGGVVLGGLNFISKESITVERPMTAKARMDSYTPKRSVSSCSLEDLAARRIVADSMALKVTTSFGETLSTVIKRNTDRSNSFSLVSILYAFISHANQLGAVDASLRSKLRLIRLKNKDPASNQVATDGESTETQAGGSESIHTIIDFMEELTEASVFTIFKGVKEELSTENKGEMILPHIEDVIQEAFGQVADIVTRGKSVGLWGHHFPERLYEPTVAFLIWYMENLCEWIGEVAKQTATSDLLKLVADSTYCRTELLNQLWERLVDLELKRSRRDMDMEYECKAINRQFLRLENALLAQYVKQQALPLKNLITNSFQPNGYTSEPVSSLRVRPYVLELLLGLAISIESCRACGLVGSRILYGLYNQLVSHMHQCISDIQAMFSISEARQIALDIEFIGTTLKEYETDETRTSLEAVFSGLHTKTSKETKESDILALENWEEIKTNALNDAFNRSSLLLQCFTNNIKNN